ncbi:Recombination protein RecR [Rickettsiales bacterium Ac37b]|nr:Recombination protein RecR [Rickettsiales bacterium Ac37b]
MDQNYIDRLAYLLSKLPGFGPRSARRAVLYMLEHRESFMNSLIHAMKEVSEFMQICDNCGNIDIHQPCHICKDHKREQHTICVVESVTDLWAMERGNIFKGNYHVLGGTLSVSENKTPKDLNIDKLLQRVNNNQVNEVILATNGTIDGQTTAYYITELLQDHNVKVSRLAYGIPVGGELDYLDENTLSIAIKSRQPF